MNYKITENKVYILLDESIWDDDYITKVVAVSFNKDTINKIAKNYIDKIKKEIDFDDLDKEDYTLDYDKDNSFSIYLSGYYNDNHINITILEKEITYDIEIETMNFIEI